MNKMQLLAIGLAMVMAAPIFSCGGSRSKPKKTKKVHSVVVKPS